MKYDVTIRRVYVVEAPSEEDAVLGALELEERVAYEYPNMINVEYHGTRKRRTADPTSAPKESS